MKLSDVGGYALGNLRRHKLRTLLTCAGVAVGVATLTVMVSLGAGLEKMVASQFDQEELTTRITVLRKGSKAKNPFDPKGSSEPQGEPITDEVVERLNGLEGVLVAYPDLTSYLTADCNERATTSGAYGLPVKALTISYKKSLLAGDYWGQEDAENVCVLPSQLLPELGFSEAKDALGAKVAVSNYMSFNRYREVVEEAPDPANPAAPPVEVSKWIRPQGLEFTELHVIGVYDSKKFGFMGRNLHVPQQLGRDLIETYPLFRFGLEEGEHRAALVKVEGHQDLDPVRKRIEAEGFDTQTVFDILGVIRIVFLVFQVMLSFFGGIGLFVAFFGIANTMVMAVLERVREIGVLKALGARDRDIRRVFVTEAAAIGFMGGLGGVAIGWLVGLFLNWLGLKLIPQDAGVESLELFYVPLWLVGIALGISTAVAIVAGLYPAWRAARQDPVIALRRE